MSDSIDRPIVSNLPAPHSLSQKFMLMTQGDPRTSEKVPMVAHDFESFSSGFGTVSSVGLTGSTGIIVTGATITSSGSFALSIDAAGLKTHLGLGDAAYRGTGNTGSNTDENNLVIYWEGGAILTTGDIAFISTTGNFGDISTSGEDAKIFTSGIRALISTFGDAAYIETWGQYADMQTHGEFSGFSVNGASGFINMNGVNGHIESRGTFKLRGDAYVTTISHAASLNRAISLPDQDGTLAVRATGPYADDTAAAAGGVPIGSLYYQASGATFTRLV